MGGIWSTFPVLISQTWSLVGHIFLGETAASNYEIDACFGRESCDTVGSGDLKDGETAHETILADCHPLICNSSQGPLDSPYYVYQPSGKTRCYTMTGKEASQLNVPMSTKSNLCRMAPEIPDECGWKQGMLMLGMKGSKHPDLYTESSVKYRDSIVSSLKGAGLFLNGGNPIYYTMKGTSEEVAKEVHSVLRGNLDDIAGHHIVFKVSNDTNTMEPFMHVDRLPLASMIANSTGSQDPVELAYAFSIVSSRKTGGNFGWLHNLESEMKGEQQLADLLYPTNQQSEDDGNSSSSIEKDWACPLMRFAFWSKVVQDFSPLSPSPVRTARIFGEASGRNMLRGTRSHPTQTFISLYPILANIMTSNGFFYCTDIKDCQILHTDNANKECTLLETIRSMYDQKHRPIRILRNPSTSPVCMQQLDWPFEAGFMRDGMPNLGMNDRSKQCSVLERLPPFKYR